MDRDEKIKELIEKAFRSRENSYSPYSKFQVGAALETADGEIFTGCNIENGAYTPSICAERTAFSTAAAAGKRKFKGIAIVGGPAGTKEFAYCPPCGVCRQVMQEFCDPDDFIIILAKSKDEYKTYTLRELLPLGFSL